ncbi:hypothetical protein AADG42_18240 [Ammonicoccus fulvus]|uniref:Uncharacterized protein n=1 Tax=Ammonicoccus fulvus TaxID=3138240 RepID=A0ABZ3FWW2_9ACTN
MNTNTIPTTGQIFREYATRTRAEIVAWSSSDDQGEHKLDVATDAAIELLVAAGVAEHYADTRQLEDVQELLALAFAKCPQLADFVFSL